MANAVKNAILKAKIEGVIYEVMPKSTAGQVYLADGSTVQEKVAGLISDVALKANTTDVEAAIAALRTELMGEGVPEAYDTFKELADYIAAHKEVSDALEAAIGNKADKSVVEAIQATVDGLGAVATLDLIGEANLDEALKTKINATAEANHAHSNKAVLDGISADKVTAWDAAEQNAKDYADDLDEAMDARVQVVEGKAHEHANKAVLDGIKDTDVAEWNSKSTVYYSASEPADLAEGDLWVCLVD